MGPMGLKQIKNGSQMGPKQQGTQMGPKWAPNMGPTFFSPHNNPFLFPQNPSQPTLQWKVPHLIAINSKLTCPMTSTSLRTCWVNWINSNHCNFENSILPRVFPHLFLQCFSHNTMLIYYKNLMFHIFRPYLFF